MTEAQEDSRYSEIAASIRAKRAAIQRLQAEVKQQESELEAMDPDCGPFPSDFQWEDWAGGQSPCAEGSTFFYVRYRDGTEGYDAAGNLRWEWGGEPCPDDIVACRYSEHNP